MAEYRVWSPSLFAQSTTTTLNQNIINTISSASQIFVWKLYIVNVTEMMTTTEVLYLANWTTTHELCKCGYRRGDPTSNYCGLRIIYERLSIESHFGFYLIKVTWSRLSPSHDG